MQVFTGFPLCLTMYLLLIFKEITLGEQKGRDGDLGKVSLLQQPPSTALAYLLTLMIYDGVWGGGYTWEVVKGGRKIMLL